MLDSSPVVDAAVGGNQNAFSEVGAVGKDQLAELIEQFGRSDVNGAIGNILGITFADLIKQVVNDSPLPDFLKDAAGEAIDGAVADERAVSTPEAEEATQEEMGDALMDLVRGMADAADEMMNEEAEGGTEGGVRGQAGGNWLVALAKALGEVAGEHLGRSVGLAGEISANAGKGGEGAEAQQAQAEKMSALQAEMQAETQMFKLAQEGLTTIVKNVGEALSSTARKQ